jgi:CheY-like chemotaxis protein
MSLLPCLYSSERIYICINQSCISFSSLLNIPQAQRRTGGTGLGLYALSKRMEALGGTCGVKDRSDGARGSCFWISIPFKPDELMDSQILRIEPGSIHRAPEKDASSTRIASMMTGFINQHSGEVTAAEDSAAAPIPTDIPTPISTPKLPSLRILLVDDSALIRKATSRALIKEGHHVEMAQHGAECLKILEASQSNPCEYDFDLILMDLQMPVMDGLETTRRIREMEHAVAQESDGGTCKNPHITIVGATANTAGDSRADCMAIGMDGFMEKPLKIQNVQSYISNLNIEALSV